MIHDCKALIVSIFYAVHVYDVHIIHAMLRVVDKCYMCYINITYKWTVNSTNVLVLKHTRRFIFHAK